MTIEVQDARYKGKEARKEIGLGCPPEDYGSNVDQAFADFCSPQSRMQVGEVARWIVDLPVADANIPGTFGNRMNVWGTIDENPPPGVIESTNTVATPNMFPSDFIIRGFRVRCLVPPEGRLIRGAWVQVDDSQNLAGIPDAWTTNDFAHGAFGTFGVGAEAPEPVPGLIMSGLANWKVAYAFLNAYELRVGQDHQNSIIKQPLTSVGTVEPFTEAEAAGNVFGASIDDVNKFNQRMNAIGGFGGAQFFQSNFKRLGTVAGGAGQVGDFTVSREEDGEPTMWGGPGVPQGPDMMKDPFILDTPLFWPAGHSISITFDVSSNFYQAEMQRWLSATGGVGGQPGFDLNLPPSFAVAQIAGYTGLAPSVPGANGMLEQSLDAAPVLVPQQTQVGRFLGKYGRMVWEVDVIGWRVTSPAWQPVVARALHRGVLSAPVGYGSIGPMVHELIRRGGR